ncbi:ATP-binding protein [Planktothrix mougeotii]|uniref:AAA family ATPase n=1 Tax=Planktothrix mougeotii LEGE 06226 TaxID=1828728 RepID=A0ABR9UDT3_9CYAN|nr:ATP-binding protein [Planktothrix mougeotii]MBE9144311.1 AAA family ATPase [Planktothrix mougeotii LEGE 06226]
MTIAEILQLADELVYTKKGKHLDDLQETIIKGLWEDQTYQEIAQESNRSESRVRNIAAKLLQLLSEELGENLEKANFRSTFNRLNISSSRNQHICHVTGTNHNFNYNPQIIFASKEDNPDNSNNSKTKSSYHDLTLAPQIIKFYNRETELQTISNWIFNQNKPLISVLGLSGIGKSYLVRRFIDLNLEQFEVIIWRSLKHPESLDLLIDDLLNFFEIEIKTNPNNKFKQLFDILTKKRCLIILDDVENIFITGEFAGQYQSQYQDYQNFFTKIIETHHQSHVILISQEKCKEMECLDEELYPVKCLELSGLDSSEILTNMGLKDEDSWQNLINLYEGNPFYLKTIANSIKNIYDGNVSEFLAENQDNCGTGILPVITMQIQTNLQVLFNKLSPIEQQIVIKLSDSEQLVSREDLKTSLDLSSTDLINSLESLQQRYILQKIKGDKIMFKLDSIFREYVKN